MYKIKFLTITPCIFDIIDLILISALILIQSLKRTGLPRIQGSVGSYKKLSKHSSKNRMIPYQPGWIGDKSQPTTCDEGYWLETKLERPHSSSWQKHTRRNQLPKSQYRFQHQVPVEGSRSEPSIASHLERDWKRDEALVIHQIGFTRIRMFIYILDPYDLAHHHRWAWIFSNFVWIVLAIDLTIRYLPSL